MEHRVSSSLPIELQEDRYTYPSALFTGIMRFDGSDDIHIPLVAESERPLVMARYAVVKALHLVCSEQHLYKIARLEVEGRSTFTSGVLKTRRSARLGDLEKGDIELMADELGVYELLFPFDPEKMRQAEEDERALLSGDIAHAY